MDPINIKNEWEIANREQDFAKKKLLVGQMRAYLLEEYSPNYDFFNVINRRARPHFRNGVDEHLRQRIEQLVCELSTTIIPDKLACWLFCNSLSGSKEDIVIRYDWGDKLPDDSYILTNRHVVYSTKNKAECLVFMSGEKYEDEDEYVYILSLRSGTYKRINMNDYITEVKSMVYDRFACAGTNGSLQIFDLLSCECTHVCYFNDERFQMKILSPTQVCAIFGNQIYLCNIDTKKVIKVGHEIEEIGEMELSNETEIYIFEYDSDDSDDSDDPEIEMLIEDERGTIFTIVYKKDDAYEIIVRNTKTLQVIYKCSINIEHFVSIQDGYILTNKNGLISVFDIETKEYIKIVELDPDIKVKNIHIIQPDADMYEKNPEKSVLWITLTNGIYIEALYNSSKKVINSRDTHSGLPVKMYPDGSIICYCKGTDIYEYYTNEVLNAIYIYADKTFIKDTCNKDDLGLFNVLERYGLDLEFTEFGKEVLCYYDDHISV